MTVLTSLRRAVRVATPVLALGTAAFTAVLAACSDAPTSPSAATRVAGASSGKAPAPTTATSTGVYAVTWAKPVTQVTVSAVIGAAGGSLQIPNGIKLIVPAGAVAGDTTFSITRLPGAIVAYDFQPHGTFAQPLTIQHPTAGTVVPNLTSVAGIQGAYFADPTRLDQTSGTALVDEFEPTSITMDKGTVTFTVNHFSGYLVSWNRR